MDMADLGLPARVLLLDHDTKFTTSFDAVFQVDGCEVKRVGPRALNMNAITERWVLSAKTECLDHFLILCERHFRHLITRYAEHHNLEPPPGARQRPAPGRCRRRRGRATHPSVPSGEEKCRQRLGGLLEHYHRAAWHFPTTTIATALSRDNSN
jgi:putative transposase